MGKVISIDGTSASGKGTLAIDLANTLGAKYINSGAIYRLLAWLWMKQNKGKDFNPNLDTDLATDLATRLSKCQIDFSNGGVKVTQDNFNVSGNNQDVWSQIKGEGVAIVTAQIAKVPEIRLQLDRMKQNMVGQHHLSVVEGRDIGSHVFIDASLKFFVDAQLSVRAFRRLGTGIKLHSDLEIMMRILKSRDDSDQYREYGRLVQSVDMIYLDTSHQTIGQSLEIMLMHAKNACLYSPKDY